MCLSSTGRRCVCFHAHICILNTLIITIQTLLALRPASSAGVSPRAFRLCGATRCTRAYNTTPLDPSLSQILTLTLAVTRCLGTGIRDIATGQFQTLTADTARTPAITFDLVTMVSGNPAKQPRTRTFLARHCLQASCFGSNGDRGD